MTKLYLKLDRITPANPQKQWLRAYYFHICLDDDDHIIGYCDLRIGHNEKVYYGGNIGYRIDEAYRGHHYAYQACLQLFEIAKEEGLDYLYITCDPDNIASSKTCSRLGGKLEGIVELPSDHDMFQQGHRRVMVYYFDLK